MKKRNTIIGLLILSWIVFSIVAIVLINVFIDNKTTRLRNEIRSNVEQIFDGKQDRGDGFVGFDDGIFDVSFNKGKVKNFTRGEIPPKPIKTDFDGLFGDDSDKSYKKRLDEWKENWGDVVSVWNLNWGSDDYDEQEDEGWNIMRIYCGGMDDEFIQISTIFPYQVALKRAEWGNYYTVPTAVNEAYDFYTTNPNSSYLDGFSKGSHREIWNKIHDSSNEYYWIVENKDKTSHYMGPSIPDGADYTKGGPIHIGGMYNGYFRVNIATTQDRYYKIEKYPWNPDIQERNRLYIFWLCGIFLFCWIPIVILIIKNRKGIKQQKETLKEKLLRICSPSKLMDNYDREKIAIANSLYQEIMNCDDDSTLIQLADKAQTELSVNMISKDDLNELKKEVNPKRFMNPYNPEKVALANELYSIISNPSIKYSEYLEVRKRMKEILTENL